MRRKLLLLLLAGLLLTGCGGRGNTADTSSQMQGENVGDTSEYSSDGEDVESDSVASENSEEAAGGDADTEQEVYVLEFTGTTIDGKAMTSEIFAQSKLTMVNVWATYCPPCINEMPDLGEIGREYETSEFQIVGIVCDVMEGASYAEKEEAESIIAETKADYPHILLNEELYYNLVSASSSVPTTYFFNQDGELLGYLVGAQEKENWVSIIEELLGAVE